MRIALVLIVVMGHKGSKLSKPKGTPPMVTDTAAAQTCPAVKLEPPDQLSKSDEQSDQEHQNERKLESALHRGKCLRFQKLPN